MKKIFLSLIMTLMITTTVMAAGAFSPSVIILEKADIMKLSDEKLIDTLIDTLVDLEAIKTFHTTSGFTPKQFEEYKGLIRFRLRLLMEIQSRNIDIPNQLESGAMIK